MKLARRLARSSRNYRWCRPTLQARCAGFSRCLTPLEPNLSPENILILRAKTQKLPRRRDALQCNIRRLDLQHPPAALVDQALYPPAHAKFLAAITQHFGVEPHAAVAVVGIERLRDGRAVFD